MSRSHSYFIILLAASAIMLPAFLLGHIIGHNSAFNVSWSAGFSDRLFAGEFYPRWLPDMSRGAGSPVFYFYGPLPFYLTAPFHLIADQRMAVVLGTWLILALSGLAFYALASAFTGSRAALVAAVVYMAMPYHLLIDVWHRAVLGEQAAFIFIPLCLLCACRLDISWNWAIGLALSFAGLLLSHLPSALAFSPFLTGMCLWTAWIGRPITVLVRAAFAAFLAAGLAAAYLVPAILLQDMIQADHWRIYRPAEHLLFSIPMTTLELFLTVLVIATVAIVAVASLGLIASGKWRLIAPWCVMAMAVLFLVSPASEPFWGLPSIFERVQFPWRSMVILDVSACMMLAFSLDARRPAVLLAFGIVFLAAVFVGHRAGGFHRPPLAEQELIALRADAPEYLPSCHASATWIVRGGSVGIVGRDFRTAEGTALLKRYFYPFLEVVADGVEIPARCDAATGFIAADIPPATQKVEIRKATLPPERAGYVISLISLMVCLAGLARSNGAWAARPARGAG